MNDIPAQRQLSELTTSEWYRNPRDSRCPHDAWLDSIEISEPAHGERNEKRETAITVRLLGAYHDGHIVFRYSGVRKYSLASNACGRGLGDWLEDDLSLTSEGLFVHRVSWAGFPKGEGSQWMIEAGEITYQWIPRSL